MIGTVFDCILGNQSCYSWLSELFFYYLFKYGLIVSSIFEKQGQVNSYT